MAGDIHHETSTGAAGRLESWKEIAAYLNRGVSTAQRWSRTEGLPVHRLPHAKAGTVFAYRSEIDAWWRERSARLEADDEPTEDGPTALSAEHVNSEHGAVAWVNRLHIPLETPRSKALVLSLLLIAVLGWGWIGRSAPRFDSLAVLPFVNAGGDEDAYLSDGITEHLINTLSETPNLRVTARPYAFRYRGAQVDPQKVGRELGVRTVLTGRVLQRDGVLNLQVDLIDAEHGSQIWGRQYTQKFADILTLQQRIAGDVADRLRGHPRTGSAALARRSTRNIEAYESYLKGRYYWNRRTEESIRRAVDHFEDALAKDPNYALAASGLADCYAVYSIFQLEPPGQSGPRAISAASRALQLDKTMAEPYAALGFVKTHYEWDWIGAEREFRRSIELDPNYANAHFWYAVYLSATGRTDLAVASSRRAQQLDPLSLVIRAGVGGEPGLYAARRYDEAIEQVRTALDLDPGFAVGHLWLALSYEQKKMHKEALSELERAAELSDNSPLVLGPLGHAYAVSGNRLKARRVLSRLEEMSAHRYVSPFDMALIQLGLGDDHQTFAWLERAFEDRSYRMHWLKVDPRFDRLRGHTALTSLLRRMHLAP